MERASGDSFDHFVKKRIFEPLSMDHSTFNVDQLHQFSNVTELYAFTKDEKKEVFHSPTWWESGEIYGAGALKASAKDIIKYLEIYRNNGYVNGKRIVSEEAVSSMLSAYIITPNKNKYGYGWMVGNYNGLDVVGHGGGVKGVSSYMLYAKEQGITITVLTNIAEVAAEDFALTVFNHLVDVVQPIKEEPLYVLTKEKLTTYCGNYESEEGTKIKVSIKDGELILNIQHNTISITPYSKHLFRLPDGKMIAFLADNHDQIKGVFRGMRYLIKCE